LPFHLRTRQWLITDSDAAYLAVFHTGRALFPCPAQIAFNARIAGFIKIKTLGFKRTGFSAELAADTTIRINVYNASFMIYMHRLFFIGAGVIAWVIRTVLAGIHLMLQRNGIQLQKNAS
jgi:hypothetical protein